VAQADAVLGPAPRLALKAALPGPSLNAVLEGASVAEYQAGLDWLWVLGVEKSPVTSAPEGN